MAVVRNIPVTAWQQGSCKDGSRADHHAAETVHTLNDSSRSFRLLIKRTVRDGIYLYFHEQRGERERMIGELKSQHNLDHLPCGQISANTLYCTIGILAITLVQLLKRHCFAQEWKHSTLRSLRYYWFRLAARLVSHARYIIVRGAAQHSLFEQLHGVFLRLTLAPAPV